MIRMFFADRNQTLNLYSARYRSRFYKYGCPHAVLRHCFWFALLVGSSQLCVAQIPQVIKVEPPGWWANHSINPVRVLIRGQNLRGATLKPLGVGLVAGPAKVNAAGTYLFVDVRISGETKSGLRTIRIITPRGSVDAQFEILAPLPRASRFQGFTTDDVIYLIMTDRFSDGDPANNDPPQSRGLYDRSRTRYYHGGDFEGIIAHLPYLKELGVTAIWLTPWYDNVNHPNEREQYPDRPGGPKRQISDYHGYGAVDFYGVEEHFGTLAKVRELVDAAHRLGIKVIQDQVANHTGPYHPWVKDPPTPTWFNGTPANHLANVWQTWSVRDPHATYQVQRETLDGWFVDVLPDLNQNDPECARYLIQNTLWWIGVTGIDAIRQDTFQYVPRTFWRQWMNAIKREYKRVNVVGEVLDGDVAHTSFFQGGRARYDGIDDRLDTLFDFPLMYAVRRAFAEGKDIRELPRILASDPLYPNASVLVPLIGNHDLKRFMNEPAATIEGLKMAQTFVMTVRGTPQLYYGDEIAMEGGDDPDNRRDFPGGFPGDGIDAFHDRNAKQNSVFQHQKLLGRLRAESEPLRRGELMNLLTTEHQYVYARNTATASVIVAFNNDTKSATVEFSVADTRIPNGATLVDRLGSVRESRVANRAVKFEIPARSSAILTAR
jgi:neopullulanase